MENHRKIAYFLLGALVASIGYGIGTLQRPLVEAKDDILSNFKIHNELFVRNVHVVDEKGNIVLILKSGDNGGQAVVIDKKATVGVVLGITKDGGIVSVSDGKGKVKSFSP